MKNENIQMISQAEEEINRVLQLLSKLKNDLHEKISNYIDSIERKRTSSQSKNLEEVSSKSPTETDYSIGTYSASSRVCADKAQIKFISDYIQTLVKSVEEIYNSLNALNHNNTKISVISCQERILYCYTKMSCRLHKELDKFHSPCSSTKKDKTSRTDTKPTSSSSSEESLKKENKASAEDFKEYKKNRRKEKKDLLQDIDQALEKISKLSKIIENINQTIEDNRLVSITNDSVVAQQGYLFKMQVDLLKMHKKDYEWLIEFSNPTRLCRMEVPDQLLYQIMNLKVKWNTTQERISNAQESLAKIRELWILFEYYTEWKREEKIIREKISRVKKIKKSLFHHTSDLSRSIIDKLWKDTESEFNALTAKL
ncbi:hypothetical protein HZS_7108 [Henneguya salminicola]|nr:hypothetical protein HZS_7108 [Henneguya salminicola]